MRTHNFKKDIDYRLFYGLVIVMVLLMNVLLNDALGRGSLCSPCDSSKCLCCRDCQCYFQCPYDKACIVEITGHDLCYEGCHYNTIGTGSMNGTYTLQPYGDECDWGAVYPSNLTLTLFYDVNHPYCPNPPNTEPCTCVYLPSAPGILVFHFHCWGSSAFLYIYAINPDTGEGGEEIFCGGTNSVTNCIECTISDSNPVFCPNGHWASPTAKITVNSDPTCASCCDTALCETCVGGECKVCGGDTNKHCCYPEDGINHCCNQSLVEPETCCNGSCCKTLLCETCVDGSCKVCDPHRLNCCDSFDCYHCVNAICKPCLRKAASLEELESCNRVDDPSTEPIPNGCSVPPLLCEIFGVDCNNPAGCGESTSFLGACNQHDLCYQTCDTEGYNRKALCDGDLCEGLESLCYGVPPGECQDDCFTFAVEYCLAVQGAGGDWAYEADQVEACACCDCN